MSEARPSSNALPREDPRSAERGPGSLRVARFLQLRRRHVVVAAVLLLLLSFSVLGWQVYASYDTLAALCFPNAQAAEGSLSRAQLGQHPFRRRSASAFDLSETTVPVDEIRSGGPPKDGIPALTNPEMVSAEQATYLRPEDRVIGFVHQKQARAYPLRILNYHEVVNDVVGTLPVAITYCPLCDSAAAFDRRGPLGEREFGVSGLLYNSNVLMYDRGGQTESLWSQLKAEGISGPGATKPLAPLPIELTSWRDWRFRHPDTKVLSGRTGHRRDYRQSPYASYFSQPGLMFPVRPTSDRLPGKARVLGVWTEGAARAYPESAFTSQHRRAEDQLGDKRVVVEFNPSARSLRVVDADEGVNWMYSFWFAWYAFHPETTVFEPVAP